ncbi:MAG: hypothetical protein V1880_02300 [Patescibacteria group bacterium]
MKITSNQIIAFIIAFLMGVGLASYIMLSKEKTNVTEQTKNEKIVNDVGDN